MAHQIRKFKINDFSIVINHIEPDSNRKYHSFVSLGLHQLTNQEVCFYIGKRYYDDLVGEHLNKLVRLLERVIKTILYRLGLKPKASPRILFFPINLAPLKKYVFSKFRENGKIS